MTTPDGKLRAVVLATLVAFSAIVVPISFSQMGLAAGNTAGNVSLSINGAGNQATVTVDDSDLNTGSNTVDSHLVNVESDTEQPLRSTQTGSDTPDSGSQTISISPASLVADETGDGTISASDFSLAGASDESITSVSLNGDAYDVTITDSGGSDDGTAESVSYTKLADDTTGTDTIDSGSITVTTSEPAGDRNGDGAITSADFELLVSAGDESITSVSRNADGTVDVTITDSGGTADSSEQNGGNQERFTYLPTESVRLTETGQDTGTFTGSIPLSQSDSNGVLYAQDSDLVTAIYGDDGGSTERTDSETLSLPALTATPTAPSTAAVGQSISLDGSGSTGSISQYRWDVESDGNTDTTGRTTTTSYASAGVKKITLTVDDGNGRTDYNSVKVAVGDSGAPTAALDVYPYTVTKDQTAYLVADSSTDDLTNGIKKYEWDIGADGSYEKSSTRSGFATHTFSSTGTKQVTLRVTDYAGNTDTVTKSVDVKGQASVASTAVEHTGNGTAPTETINVQTRNAGGMLKFHLYRGSSSSNRDLSAAGVDESTELWVNITMSNYEPDAMMGGAKVDSWTTTTTNGGNTKLSIKMHPIRMQRLSTVNVESPGRWPSQNKQADQAITPGAHLATFDMPDGTDFGKNMEGATLTSDAQVFSPPQYDSQTQTLTYSVAAPHWNKTGSKVDSNTNRGFYEATIPEGMVDQMGIENPGELSGSYASGGQTSDLSSMTVEETVDGDLHLLVTGIHYSAGDIKLQPDTTDPTANAGSDQTVDEDTSVSFDGSGSSDNRAIETYEWDWTSDGTYDATGETPSHTFSQPGSYTVTLRVTDGAGNTATDTLSVTVNNVDNSGSSSSSSASTATPTPESTSTPTSSASGGESDSDTPADPETDQSTPSDPASDDPSTPAPATGSQQAEDDSGPASGDESDTSSDEPTARGTAGASGPGFGPTAALLALLATALLARRRG